MIRYAAVLVGLVGCGGGSGGTDTDTGTTTTTTTTTGTPAVRSGDCDVDLTGSVVIESARQVASIDDGYGAWGTFPEGDGGVVFMDLASYTQFLADVGSDADPAAVDFASEVVVAVWYWTNASCSVRLEGWEARDVEGSTHVRVDISDASLECATSCDAEGAAWVAVAVPAPASGEVTWCRQVMGGCL